jgi:hypothetical protein
MNAAVMEDGGSESGMAVTERPRTGAPLASGTGSRAISVSVGAARFVFVCLTAIGVLFYIVRIWTIYAAGELFHRIGFDWTMFYAQAMVLRQGDGSDMYAVARIQDGLQTLSTYYVGTAPFQTALPVPYPPFFAALIEPFTLPSAPSGFALWALLSIGCAGLLAYRVKQFLPELPRVGAVTLVLAAYPVAFCLFMGQVGLILAVAVSEMMISLRAGRELRAGLWLAVLLIKPQYVVLFALLLLWKWRLRAIVGGVIGGAVLTLIGLIGAGPIAFLRFPAALAAMADFRNGIAGPWWMINWRSFVLYAMPGLENNQGAGVVAGLTIVTVLLLAYLWRGPWDPGSPYFVVNFAALSAGVVITSYHSHVHGAPLIIVPIAAAWKGAWLRFETRVAILAFLYVPTVMLVWVGGVLQHFAVLSDPEASLWMVWPDALPGLLFVTAFLMLYRDVWNIRAPSIRLSFVYPRAWRTSQ